MLMTNGFVGLIFNFCASIAPPWSSPGQTTIEMGYVSDGQCVVQMIVGDSHGETVTINGHSLSFEILEGGAQVNIDDQGFAMISTLGA